MTTAPRQPALWMPEERLKPDDRYIPSLNGLRAASILLVIGGHYITQWIPGAPNISGQFGVTVFFVISGFLISRLLIAEFQRDNSISIFKFYARRALRLYPVLILFVVVMMITMSYFGNSDHRAAVCTVLYLSNYCNAIRPDIFDGLNTYLLGTWSLSVEEQFYLIAAPALIVFLRKRLLIAYGAICLAIIGPFLVRVFYTFYGFDVRVIAFNAETRFDSLAFGVLLSLASSHEGGRTVLQKFIGARGFLLGLACFVVAYLMKRSHSLEWPPTHTALAASLALLMLNVLFSPQLRLAGTILNFPPIDWLGRLSYSIYLWHFCAMMFVDQSTLERWPKVIVATVATLLISACSYHLVERYFVRFKDRLH